MNNAFDEPTIVWHSTDAPDRPLVVLLHGRGADEAGIINLAGHLPAGPSYAAVRAPIPAGSGYAWFANRGIGRPVAESLNQTMAWFRAWLDHVAPAGRQVILVGFSGGAAFAGGLLLSDPQRFAGAAILYGTLPFDAGVPTSPARLASVPVFVAHGETDTVIPHELLERTWTYLLGESGAPTYARRDPGGHGLTEATVSELGGWIRERLQFLALRGPMPSGPSTWTALPGGALPARSGPRPEVSWSIPQEQRSDNSPRHIQEQLLGRITALSGVTTRQSAISVPGAYGFVVERVPPPGRHTPGPRNGHDLRATEHHRTRHSRQHRPNELRLRKCNTHPKQTDHLSLMGYPHHPETGCAPLRFVSRVDRPDAPRPRVLSTTLRLGPKCRQPGVFRPG